MDGDKDWMLTAAVAFAVVAWSLTCFAVSMLLNAATPP